MWADKGKRSVPREGQRWAHFQIKSEIARGNMGVVYRALDTRSQEEVALKILVVVHSDPDAGKRFKREAKSLARLSHPNIVGIHSYGVHDEVPFLTMDYVPGTTLQQLLERAGLPVARVVDMLKQIALGIDHAHSRGVLHRDVKPANILIGPDGAPQITDFGLARLADASISVTRDGDLIGTPVFMSPEQIQGTLSALGPASDVWAIGVTFYFMLTGKLPFGGRSVDEVSRRVVQGEPTPPRKLDPKIHEDLERICLASLRKDPKLRYRSAGELARDLRAYQRGEPVLAGRVTPALRARRALRFLRLHAIPASVTAGAVVLIIALLVALGAMRSGQAERDARDLVERALLRREAAWTLLESAEDELANLEPQQAADHARKAEVEIGWAAAYMQRAWLARPSQDRELPGPPAFQALPKPEEVALGLERDPTLVALRARIRGLFGRAGVSALSQEAEEDPAPYLEQAFSTEADLTHLEALLDLAERSRPELVSRVRALFDARWGSVPLSSASGPRLLKLRARLIDLETSDPRSEWEPHREGEGRLALAARELEAGWSLEHGDLVAARKALGARRLGGSAAHQLLKLRLARASGDWAQVRALALNLSQTRGAVGVRARLEEIAMRLDVGLPRGALARLRTLRFKAPHREALPPALNAEATLLEASALWLSQPTQPRLLWGISSDRSLPASTRQQAVRLARLQDPTVTPPPASGQLQGEARRIQMRAEVARLRPAIDVALGRVALRKLDIPFGDERTPHSDADALNSEAVALGDPDAIAGAAIVLMDRDLINQAQDLLDGCPPGSRRRPEIRLARRLLLERPFQGDALGEVLDAPPPPRGTWEGLAALAAYMGATDKHRERRRTQLAASRALDLAVRRDPFQLLPRLLRAKLMLLTAAEPTRTDEEVKSARLLALRDSAAACAIAPDAPEAWSMLLQALWVCERRRFADLSKRFLASWLVPQNTSLEPPERILLPRLRELSQSSVGPGWFEGFDRRKAEGEAARRLLAQLTAAERPDQAGWRLLRGLQLRVAGTLAQRLELDTDAPPLLRALLRAELVLERPSALDALLLEAPIALTAEEEQALEAMIQDQADRAGAARVVRIVRALQGLTQARPELSRERYPSLLKDLFAAACRRPGPGVLALRAAIEVWTGEPKKQDLPDLVVWRWKGALYELLSDLANERPPSKQPLAELPPLRRLLR